MTDETAVVIDPNRATVNANIAATAWLNAFLASGQSEDRPALFRTLSVELFDAGVQFIGCDGTILLRTWAPIGEVTPMPLPEEAPNVAVVVMDVDKFAVTFVRNLLAVSADAMGMELSLAVEAAEDVQAPLGDEFTKRVLTLHAFGQQLHCRLLEQEYPNWRGLQYGLEETERVEGMTLAKKMFATIGKLRGVDRIDCEFHGEQRKIVVNAKGVVDVTGFMMPMRRAVGPQTQDEDEQ